VSTKNDEHFEAQIAQLYAKNDEHLKAQIAQLRVDTVSFGAAFVRMIEDAYLTHAGLSQLEPSGRTMRLHRWAVRGHDVLKKFNKVPLKESIDNISTLSNEISLISATLDEPSSQYDKEFRYFFTIGWSPFVKAFHAWEASYSSVVERLVCLRAEHLQNTLPSGWTANLNDGTLARREEARGSIPMSLVEGSAARLSADHMEMEREVATLLLRYQATPSRATDEGTR
jgi:hypothetical protein